MRFVDRHVDPDATPLRWLLDNIATADTFHARVGYLDRAGVSLIAEPLRDMLDRGGEAHIVVDARDDRPRRTDIAWLLDLFAPYRERATVTLIRDASPMHAKVFAVRDTAGQHRGLVGSANLTGAGLTRNWEACVAVDPDDDEVLGSIVASAEAWAVHPAAAVADLGKLASVTADGRTGVSRRLDNMLSAALHRATTPVTIKDVVPTGLDDLDDLLGGGLRRGELVLVAGRPSMGKSTLVLDWVRHASIAAGVPALLLSFEMTEAEIMTRVLSASAGVPLLRLRAGDLNEADQERLLAVADRIALAPLLVNESCSPSIRQVAAEARRAVAEDGVRLVVVDYVQQLYVDRRVDSRQHEIAEISRSLKHLARELRVPVVAVSQLNRGPESRPDRRPVLSDLRDSGGLEQDADAVVLVHRDDYYDRASERMGEADLILAKQRNGPTDTVTVAAQLHVSRFASFALDDERTSLTL